TGAAADQPRQLRDLSATADERAGRPGEIRVGDRPQRREPPPAELEEPDRFREVLQPVRAEVGGLPLDQVARGLGEEHLPAVPGGRDSRAQVHVGAHVALVGQVRRAGVEPHADADRAAAKRRLRLPRRLGRVDGGREGDAEGISLGIHLDATVPREGLAQQAAVLGERLGVGLGAEVVQQLGGALDVGEQEGHRSRGQIAPHARRMPHGRTPFQRAPRGGRRRRVRVVSRSRQRGRRRRAGPMATSLTEPRPLRAPDPPHALETAETAKLTAAVALLAILADAGLGHGLLWENDPYWTYWVTKTFLIATVFGVGTALVGAGPGRGAAITVVHTVVLTVYYWSLSPVGLPSHPQWLDLEHT